MIKDHFIGIYWGARKERFEDCLDKIEFTLSYLGKLDESFSLWYSTNRPKKGEVVRPIDLGKSSIESFLIQGQNYDDVGRLVEDLGFQLHLKSEANSKISHMLSFTCGGYSKVSHLIPNNVNLTIKGAMLKSEPFDTKMIELIYSELNQVWKPESGVMREDDNKR